MVSTLKMIKQKYYFRQKGHFKLFRANMLALIKARTFANVLLRKASLLEMFREGTHLRRKLLSLLTLPHHSMCDKQII